MAEYISKRAVSDVGILNPTIMRNTISKRLIKTYCTISGTERALKSMLWPINFLLICSLFSYSFEE